MNKINKAVAGLLSVSLIAALSACGGTAPTDATTASAGETTTTAATTVTTTIPTVEIVTTSFADEEMTLIDQAAEKLPDVDLPNGGALKWLATYDQNPTTSGQPKTSALELFEVKYGGSVKWYQTTWETRFDDLSRYVLGGEGIDFVPGDDEENFPKGVVNGMFEPVDDYIDLSLEIFDPTRDAMELLNFGGKHYEVIYNVAALYLVSYNKQTIEDNGLDDPYELWQAGNWNWDTFEELLLDYVDPENEMLGLDGWYNDRAIYMSAGVPIVGSENGNLVSNINSPTIEKAMNYGYELWQNGLIVDQALYAWNPPLYYMGEGKELFYIGGWWHYTQHPDTWVTKIPPENLGIVPVPSPADQDPVTAARLDGFAICKGASNPEAVAAFAYCWMVANQDPELQKISVRQFADTYMISEDLIRINQQIDQVAKDNPVIDLAAGASEDIFNITTNGGDSAGTRAAFKGVEWSQTREATADTLEMLVEEVNVALQNAVATE
ncbi:MAG: extracellular solute-binding protein [Ruminococcus sp.]|nr:extracellular solute-binding protein [Ruminococcus sp.]